MSRVYKLIALRAKAASALANNSLLEDYLTILPRDADPLASYPHHWHLKQSATRGGRCRKPVFVRMTEAPDDDSHLSFQEPPSSSQQ
jgi:hypothetical protein